ncbi:hypothetical protein ACFLTZ_06560 [Chloroflexota bacterium]
MRFQIVQGDEQLSSNSGLALAGAILHRSSIYYYIIPTAEWLR